MIPSKLNVFNVFVQMEKIAKNGNFVKPKWYFKFVFKEKYASGSLFGCIFKNKFDII